MSRKLYKQTEPSRSRGRSRSRGERSKRRRETVLSFDFSTFDGLNAEWKAVCQLTHTANISQIKSQIEWSSAKYLRLYWYTSTVYALLRCKLCSSPRIHQRIHLPWPRLEGALPVALALVGDREALDLEPPHHLLESLHLRPLGEGVLEDETAHAEPLSGPELGQDIELGALLSTPGTRQAHARHTPGTRQAWEAFLIRLPMQGQAAPGIAHLCEPAHLSLATFFFITWNRCTVFSFLVMPTSHMGKNQPKQVWVQTFPLFLGSNDC